MALIKRFFKKESPLSTGEVILITILGLGGLAVIGVSIIFIYSFFTLS